MILYDLEDSEKNPVYGKLSADNLSRQYDFLKSATVAALRASQPMLSTALVKALNYHAIACLHVHAGEYRPCAVNVGGHQPPEHYRVPELSYALGARARRPDSRRRVGLAQREIHRRIDQIEGWPCHWTRLARALPRGIC